MYDVRPDYQGNFQSGFFHCQPLQVIDFFDCFYIEKATDLFFANHITKLTIHHRACHQVATGRKVQLSQLLTDRHFTHQVCDKAIHLYLFSPTRLRTGKEYNATNGTKHQISYFHKLFKLFIYFSDFTFYTITATSVNRIYFAKVNTSF